MPAIEGLDDPGEQLPSGESQSQPFPMFGILLYLDVGSQAGPMSAPNSGLLCICPKRLQDHD